MCVATPPAPARSRPLPPPRAPSPPRVPPRHPSADLAIAAIARTGALPRTLVLDASAYAAAPGAVLRAIRETKRGEMPVHRLDLLLEEVLAGVVLDFDGTMAIVGRDRQVMWTVLHEFALRARGEPGMVLLERFADPRLRALFRSSKYM